MKKALITGIIGQDGSYLAEFLLAKDYEVHGLVRCVAAENPEHRFSRFNSFFKKVKLHHGDITDYPTLWKLVYEIKPDEIYHLAAQSQIKVSFEDEFSTFRTNTNSTHYLLSAIKDLKPDARFYFAATSEMFGDIKVSPQNENTPFNPVSPYAISKLTSYCLTRMYREAYKIFACSGIFFNHESPRRGFEFVTRKITRTATRIKFGLEKELRLGNLDAKRDWGFAGDYVEAIWLMLQQTYPEDFVIGSGETHTVQEFVEVAFEALDLDWRKYVVVDPAFMRPLEKVEIKADITKAKTKLGWSPKIQFKELVRMMVKEDLKHVR